jgi:hypothetical protein
VELEMQQNVPLNYLPDPMTRKKGISMLVVEIITIFCSSSAKSDLFATSRIADMRNRDLSLRELMTAYRK